MNRREFWKTGGMLGAILSLSNAARTAEPHTAAHSSSRLTSIAYNVLACRGYPENDSNRSRLVAAREQMIERLSLELSLYRPDLVTFSESPPEAVVASIASKMGMNYAWFEGGWPGNDDYPGGFPGTIMSRFPITAAENCPLSGGGNRPEALFTRHWCRANLEMESGSVSVFSAHLHPSDAAIREQEITEILKVITPEIESGRPVILQGDLNHAPDGPEYPRWTQAGLTDTFLAQEQVHPFTIPSTTPRSRIDYIWAGGSLAQEIAEASVLFEGAFRTNADDTTSFALSDHLPVLATFGKSLEGDQ